MSDLLKKLTERRANIWEQMKALADTAAEEGRNFSGEEQASWDGMNAEIEALDKRRQSIAEAEKRTKETEETFASLNRQPQERGGGGEEQGVNAELRAWLQGKSGSRTFNVQPPAQPVAFRDLTVGSATAGGNTVPQGFYGRLVEHLVETGTVLQMANVLNTASGETLPIPKTTAHGAAAQVNEGAGLAESDPTFGVVNLGAYKYGQLIQVSRELVDDTGVDLMGYLARAAGRNLGLQFGPHLVTGDGSSKPRGVLADTTAGATGPTSVSGGFGTQSTAGQGGDLLIDLFYSVTAPYRASSSTAWLMADSTAAVVRKLKTSTGEYAWQPALTVGAPDTILGKPVRTDPNVPAVGLSAKSVVFGDWSAYFVRIVGPIRFERSDDYAFNSDMVTFRALMRGDAATVDLTGAIKHFVGGAS